MKSFGIQGNRQKETQRRNTETKSSRIKKENTGFFGIRFGRKRKDSNLARDDNPSVDQECVDKGEIQCVEGMQADNVSQSESQRINLANNYNISTEEESSFASTVMTMFSGVYTISKATSFRLSTQLSNYTLTLPTAFLPTISQESYLPTLSLITILNLLLGTWLLRKYRARRRQAQQSKTEDSMMINNMEGMKILRSRRDRSSTYDFFGMHLHQARSRGNSFDDLMKDLSPMNAQSPPEIRRERVGSMDIFYSKLNKAQRPPNKKTNAPQPNGKSITQFAAQDFVNSQIMLEGGDDEGFLYDEFGLVTMSFDVEYYGPLQRTLNYGALTPPQPWGEASRYIIPKDIRLRLKRNLILDVGKATILVQEPNSKGQWDYALATKDVSIYVVNPPAGGVIQLYEKGTPREKWNEFTFESSRSAAQFQLDLLAYQVLGKTLNNIFEALSILHQGSIAYGGQELVLHHNRFEVDTEETKEELNLNILKSTSCATWDDAMRALSSIPSIRIALERLWLSHRNPDDTSKGKTSGLPIEESGLIAEAYANKRVLLGPVDFFRLFVPDVPDSAVLQTESNKMRMEQLLSWRKRAARAAVLVRAYVNSRKVVNLGWNLFEYGQDNIFYMKKRLSYDDNADNMRKDSTAKNEYYEASVSRDVLCHVRPFDYFSTVKAQRGMNTSEQASLVLSPYQAYSLVGMHIFKIPEIAENGNSHAVNLFQDPVEAFPSLRKLISENPGLDFTVLSVFNSEKTVCVACYVRSLAKGIDPKFDNVIDRFMNGSKQLRDRKLQLMIQLGQQSSLSPGGWLFVRALSLYLSFMKGRESPLLGLETTKDRFPIPSMRLADYAETHHFGGSLQENPELPKNYVSMTVSFETFLPNKVAHFFFHLVEKRLFARAIDFTFLLEGEQDDELPERALCTTRTVHLETLKVPILPSYYFTEPNKRSQREAKGSIGLSNWATDRVRDALYFLSPSDKIDEMENETLQEEEFEYDLSVDDSATHLPLLGIDDPLERATDDVIEVLHGIKVPSRGATLDHNTNLERIPGIPALKVFSRHDIHYFLETERGDVERASLRMLETAKWKAQTFPLDKLQCRIELQSGQFFQHGIDLRGNPVFYFRCMCIGPWRNDVDASIAAVLYRFNKSMSEFLRDDPSTKFTIIVLMGRPMEPGKFVDVSRDFELADFEEGGDEEDSSSLGDSSSEDESDLTMNESNHEDVANPRIPPNETWHKHTNKDLIRRLSKLFLTHYPGRLNRILVVQGKGKNRYYSNALQRQRVTRSLLPKWRIRQQLRFVDKFSDLCKYVDKDELVTIVGGTAKLRKDVFEGNR